MINAYRDGYGNDVDNTIKTWAARQAHKESARKSSKLIVAEIGGGYGNFYDKIKNICENYLNIEPSNLPHDNKLNFSDRVKESNYFQLQASAEDIPIADSQVDVAIALACLDHIPDTAKAIQEIARILKPGGILIFSLNNKGSWWKRLLKNSKFLKRREEEILKDHYFLWDTEDAEKAFANLLEIETMETVCHCPQIPYLWKALIGPVNALGSRFAPKLGSNIIAVLRKPQPTR